MGEGDADGGGNGFCALLARWSDVVCHLQSVSDSMYCHAHVAKLKEQDRGVTFLWRYGDCLSRMNH